MKEYKVMSQKGKCLSSEFDPEKLEQSINAYAEKGWGVISISVLPADGLPGGWEEIIVVFEREIWF